MFQGEIHGKEGTILGDARPGAPVHAYRGSCAFGVKTLSIVRHAVPDFSADGRLSERKLLIETWYPAEPVENAPLCTYQDHMGRSDLMNLTPFSFPGRAIRDAHPVTKGMFPAIVLSHGYPGSRFLLSNLAENLASKGYYVFSIGHTDNTYTDFLKTQSFESALVHRSADQRALLDALPEIAHAFNDTIDLDAIGLIGFSMGGYGTLRTIGAKVNPDTIRSNPGIADLLKEPDWEGDARIRAAVLFAPATFLIDAEHLDAIRIPTMTVCGTMDTTVHYDAVRKAFLNMHESDRTLVSYLGCGHNVANNPAPDAAMTEDWSLLKRWADPVWDTWRLNNNNQHFVTEFFGRTLLGQPENPDYTTHPFPGFVADTDGAITVETLSKAN